MANRQGDTIMGFYMLQGRYAHSAIKNLVAGPQDRTKSAADIAKAAGGKMHSFFMSFGDYDFVVIMEQPDDQAAGALSMALGAAGYVTDLKTTKLFTGSEAKAAMKAASDVAASIRPPQGK
jgi:uncharacterized protein with GYD domain